MALFVDLFGYLSVVLRGGTLAMQALAVGGVAFLLVVARPRAPWLGELGHQLLTRCRRGIVGASLGLALFAVLSLGSDLSPLIELLGLQTADPLNASFVRAGLVQAGAGLALAFVARRPNARAAALVAPALVMVGASVATSHAAARLDHQVMLGAVTFLHESAACCWIGALPYLLDALSLPIEGKERYPLARRFHFLAATGVGTLLASAAALSYAYIGALDGFYGTAYGLMVCVKMALAFTLLGLGFANSRRVERLRHDPDGPLLALRRFTEVEVGLGITVFLATASLISVPPAVDLRTDRLTLTEMGERLIPNAWPRFDSPEHSTLALQRLQMQLDAEAAAAGKKAAPAYVPGAGIAVPYTAEDIAWSEYNHHWAGVFVLAIGVLALIERIWRAKWARSWPLLFAGLAVFLLIRSDPEAWPMGSISFWASFREPEVAQHRIFMSLITVFAFFEWSVRTGRTRSRRAALVLPLLCALGGAILLTHSHALGNVKWELLIEYTHAPLALLGVAAGWSRWLEVRLPGTPAASRASWIWPISFALVGLLLIFYREA